MELLKQIAETVGIPAKVKDNTQLAYWCKLFDNFNFSPKEFYAMTAKNLETREIPDLEPQYVMLQQSGILSAKRLYVQLRRERLVFEICAAPFGAGFFVSSRLFDRRREANLLQLAGICLGVLLIAGGIYQAFGGWGVFFSIVAAIAAKVYFSRFAPARVMKWLDRTVPGVPGLGLVYEHFFLRDTYYRQDAAQCYREAVHNAVMQSIDEMTALKGLKPLSTEERRPILSDLHRR